MPPSPQPAAFIDKDGTLVDDVAFNVDPARLRFTPHAGRGLRLLVAHGYRIIVITNQPGIALGLFDAAALARLTDALSAMLATEGIVLGGFYACPHGGIARGFAPCACRKPAPGLLHLAAERHGIDLRRSWMIGDILDDIEAGHRAGCRTVLLDTGHETEWRKGVSRTPTYVATDLLGAAHRIVGDANLQASA